MKSFLFAVSVLAFSCGGPLSYGGRFSESATLEGVSSRTSREAEFSVTGQQQLIIDGWKAPLIATIEGSVLTIQPSGEVLGGSGSFTGERLAFTVLIARENGFASISFDGELGKEIDGMGMTDEVHAPGHVSPASAARAASNDSQRLFNTQNSLPTFVPELAQPLVDLAPPVATR